jgi:hypothetical protein
MNRRGFLESTAMAALLFEHTLAADEPMSPHRLQFQVEETAGLRRYGYPVTTFIPTQPVAGRHRLLRDHREVPAQFSLVKDLKGRTLLALDFNASPGPFEVQNYELELHPETEAPARLSGGIKVVAENSSIKVKHEPYITYTFPTDLGRFLQSVRTKESEFVEQGSAGLWVEIQGKRQLLGSSSDKANHRSSQISRQGPLAVGIDHADSLIADDGSRFHSALSLTLPSSKSWVEAEWSVSDPHHQIEAIGLDLALKLEGPPFLVDCGANSTVYGTL